MQRLSSEDWHPLKPQDGMPAAVISQPITAAQVAVVSLHVLAVLLCPSMRASDVL
jgi:hypothetical protein